jgi:hypothetical protein
MEPDLNFFTGVGIYPEKETGTLIMKAVKDDSPHISILVISSGQPVKLLIDKGPNHKAL